MNTTVQTTERVAFSTMQRRKLTAMRTRYAQDHDLFSAHELAKLHFLRWLYKAGRLVP